MDLQPSNPLVQSLNIRDIVEYLRDIGWESTKPYKKGLQVFQGSSDANGEPLEIVLPIDDRSPDKTIYTSSALNLLAALNDEVNPENLVQKIKFSDRDILRIRDIDTEGYNSVEISTAAIQVPAMRQLVAYAVCAEYRVRPYYFDISRAAHQTLRHFRFGPTFAGSFGFTIESRIREQRQLSLASQSEEPGTQQLMRLPIERRAIERIMRGLLSVQRALHNNDSSVIAEAYRTGLNLNMCNAILEISHGEKAHIEYDISWSPKINPSDDIDLSEPIILDEESYRFIREAVRRLRGIDPEETTIKGHVTALISRNNPLSTDEKSRHVTIRWSNRGGGRAVDVSVFLQREDYIQAHDAHLNWLMVEVRGVIMRKGDFWELLNPHNFHVLPPSNEPVSIPLIET